MRRLTIALAVLVVLAGLSFQPDSSNWVRPRTIAAQNDCQTFPETGKRVCGIFLSYWKANGGLAQQGFPISDVFREQSSNGQTYDTQYFERAVFERHPENAGTKFEVLLALLGSERLKTKNPGGPPAGQAPAPDPPPAPAPPAPAPGIAFQGSGQTVTPAFQAPADVSRVTLRHTGRNNFIVWAYAADGERDLLVNESGDYAGSVALVGRKQWYLEIKAESSWSITVDPLPTEQSASQGVEGRGDYASGYFTPSRQGAVPHTFTHDGSGHFAVWLRCRGGADLAQNETGAVNNSAVVDFKAGPCYWDITADGNWKVRPR